MKSYDFEAIVFDGEIYCIDCSTPDMVKNGDPIFADSEWDYYPHCCNCGEKMDYVNLTADGIYHENELNQTEQETTL